MTFRTNRFLVWLVPALLLALFFAIVLLAPLEKTLGETIRLVYAHAAFTRAGMLGYYLCGLLGAIIIISNSEELESWTQAASWVSFGFFLVGGLFSIFAQRASWGGLIWAEPRNRTTLTVIALSIIVLLLNAWIPWIRMRGLLYSAFAIYMSWIIPATPLMLHPDNAVDSSPSVWIRLTFPVLTALALLLGLWMVAYLKRLELKV